MKSSGEFNLDLIEVIVLSECFKVLIYEAWIMNFARGLVVMWGRRG